MIPPYNNLNSNTLIILYVVMRNKTTVISHRVRLQAKCYVIYQVLSDVFIGYPIAYIGLPIYNDVR